MEEVVSSELQLAELRQQAFRSTIDKLYDRASSILDLTLQWKEVEGHYAAAHNAIEERAKEVRSVEDSVNRRLEELERREAVLNERAGKFESLDDAVEERAREVEVRAIRLEDDFERLKLREKRVEAVRELNIQELERIQRLRSEIESERGKIESKLRKIEERERKCGLRGNTIEKRVKEIEVKEKKTDELFEKLKLKEKQVEKLCEELELKEKLQHERFTELQLQEKKLNQVSEGFKLKEEKIQMKLKAISLKELQIIEQRQEVASENLRSVERFRVEEERVEQLMKEVELEKIKVIERLAELASREKQIEFKERQILQQCKEAQLKSVGVVRVQEQKVEQQLKEFESEKKKFAERLRELESRENQLHERVKEVEDKEKKIDNIQVKFADRLRELESREKQLDERVEEVEGKEKKIVNTQVKFAERLRELESRENQLHERVKEVEDKEKTIDNTQVKFADRLRELESREKQVNEMVKEVEVKEKKIVNSQVKCADRLREFESREKQVDEMVKEVQVKGKKIVNTQVKIEPTDASVSFSVIMDGKAFQIFLNERGSKDESLRDEVTTALTLSPDPAKLVLDAMQGFYPPHLKKGEVTFEGDVVRDSCITLLQLLMKISPQIRPCVKKEATELAFNWRKKMRADAEHSQEVFGFLHLLASYGLASYFCTNELLQHLEIVAEHSQAPELFCALGFADKISGFVQTLIRKKELIKAFNFLYAFELVNKFPPVPLLKDYFKDSKTEWKSKKIKSLEAQKRRLSELRAVVRCIEDHNIKCDIQPKQLKYLIDNLEKQISERAHIVPLLGCKTMRTNSEKENHCGPNVFNVASSNPAFIPQVAIHASEHLSPQKSGNKRPHSSISEVDNQGASTQKSKGFSTNQVHHHPSSVEIQNASPQSMNLDRIIDSSSPSLKCNDGENSRLLLGKHDPLHGENSSANEPIPESAKHVLDTMKFLVPLDLKDSKAISEENTETLLKMIRKISSPIDPDVKKAALEFAVGWKTKLMKKREGQSEVLVFLEFLATYGLASSFASEDMLSLWGNILGHKRAFDLQQALGLTDKISDLIQSLIESNQRIEAVKHIYAIKMAYKFHPACLLHDHLRFSKKIAEELRKKGNNSISAQIVAIEEELSALRAVIKCIAIYNLGHEISPTGLRGRVVELEKQKAEKKSGSGQSNVEGSPCTKSMRKRLRRHKKKSLTTTTGAPITSPDPAEPSTAPLTVTTPSLTADAAATASAMSLPSTTEPTPSKPSPPSTIAPSSATNLETQPQQGAPNESTCAVVPSTNPPPSASKMDTSPSSTVAPSSAATPETQPQEHSQNKRRKVVSTGPSLQPPRCIRPVQPFQQPASYYMNHHGPYLDLPAAHYSLTGHSFTNLQRSSFYNDLSRYCWNNYQNPGDNRGP